MSYMLNLFDGLCDGWQGGETAGKAERALVEDVYDAIYDLVELIKTYQNKNRLSQVLMSTLFRRRQDDMGAAVDRAILGLHVGDDAVQGVVFRTYSSGKPSQETIHFLDTRTDSCMLCFNRAFRHTRGYNVE